MTDFGQALASTTTTKLDELAAAWGIKTTSDESRSETLDRLELSLDFEEIAAHSLAEMAENDPTLNEWWRNEMLEDRDRMLARIKSARDDIAKLRSILG